MANRALCSLLKSEASRLFDEKHLFSISAKKYRFVEDIFTADCLSSLQKIPRSTSVEDYLSNNILDIGDRSKGAYLSLSAIYRQLIKDGEPRKASKLAASFSEMRIEVESSEDTSSTGSSEESESSGSDESSSEEENGLMIAVRKIYNTSVKPQLAQVVTNLEAKPPSGVRYSPQLTEERQASLRSLSEGMQKFESVIGQ